MNLTTLWHSPVILPSKQASEIRSTSQSSTTPDSPLPRWEQHPWRRSHQGDGGLDQDWIRTHLP